MSLLPFNVAHICYVFLIFVNPQKKLRENFFLLIVKIFPAAFFP